MMKIFFTTILNKYIVPVPDLYKENLERSFIITNFKRLFPLSILILMFLSASKQFKGIVFTIPKSQDYFIISSLILIPFIYLVWRKKESIPIKFAKVIQALYYFTLLIFSLSLTLFVKEIDFLHIYIMTVFGVAMIADMHPLNKFFLIFPSHLLYIIILPHIESNPLISRTYIINLTTLNLLSFILGVMIYNTRISSFINQELIIEKNKTLAELVKRDGMTGLYNHKASIEILKVEINNANIDKKQLSLIMADIDDFKKVNDRYGHLIGDEVICNLADISKEIFKKHGYIGRYGGEEFIIILKDTDLSQAEDLFNDFQRALKKLNSPIDYELTISGGISQYKGQLSDELISLTDQKLYQAKRLGKNRFISSLREI